MLLESLIGFSCLFSVFLLVLKVKKTWMMITQMPVKLKLTAVPPSVFL